MLSVKNVKSGRFIVNRRKIFRHLKFSSYLCSRFVMSFTTRYTTVPVAVLEHLKGGRADSFPSSLVMKWRRPQTRRSSRMAITGCMTCRDDAWQRRNSCATAAGTDRRLREFIFCQEARETRSQEVRETGSQEDWKSRRKIVIK